VVLKECFEGEERFERMGSADEDGRCPVETIVSSLMIWC
jgi:hypothetical protein